MKRFCVAWTLAILLLGAWVGVGDAARGGGTFNFVAAVWR